MISQLDFRLALTLLFGVTVVPAGAQEWTRFRGPNGSGIAAARDLPSRWTEKDYAWKVPVPGAGHSSPVLWGDRLFVTSADPKAGARFVHCYHAADGRTLWTREFGAKSYRTHLRNSFATATPTADAHRLYVSWATPEAYTVQALDHDGKQLWQADLGPYKSQHGFGVSPVVYEDLVVVANEQDGGGALIGLEATTGAVRWKVPRQGKNATYSTPCVYQAPGRPAELIFTNWQHGITAVDPKTGRVNWELSVFETEKQERAIASPVVAGDLVLGTCGFVSAQKHLVAIRPHDPQHDGKPREVWRLERAVSYLPTPLFKDGRVFLCSEQGMATCLNAATGQVVWQERVGGAFSASPVCADDKIYCVSNEGNVLVLAASDKFAVLGRSELGEPTQSTPAVARGRIYFRTQGHLSALGGGK